jgi:hypothetical protein
MTTLTTILVTNKAMMVLAVIMALTGAGMRYWIKRSRFNRRNAAGIEGFKSYEQMRLIGLLEMLGLLAGGLLLLGGVLLFLLFYITGTPHHK